MATESTDIPGELGRRGVPHSAVEPGIRSAPEREPRRRVTRNVTRVQDERVARALSWVSIGLGFTALLAPRPIGNFTGIGVQTGLLRAVGLALIAGGTASAGLRQMKHPYERRRVEGVTEEYLERSVVINKSPRECYDYWRNFANLPNFMRMIDAVTDLGDRRSHWVARIPGGTRFEWDARLSEDLPGERIAWHSAPDSPLLHAGVVSFHPAPGARGTIVSLVLHYRPPAGSMGRFVAKALGSAPEFEINEDLRRFKQILETNEIATTRGQPAGRRSLLARGAHVGRGS
jgi:uncharacterized membrane protein